MYQSSTKPFEPVHREKEVPRRTNLRKNLNTEIGVTSRVSLTRSGSRREWESGEVLMISIYKMVRVMNNINMLC